MSIDRKYLSYTRLGEYDELLKDKMAKDDAATLSSANAHAESLAAGKSDKSHLHDDRYYTESEIDTKLSDINTSINNIKGGTIVVKNAEHATSADSATTANSATTAGSATKATQDGNGKVISSTYETKTDAGAKLAEAKTYTDEQVEGLGAGFETVILQMYGSDMQEGAPTIREIANDEATTALNSAKSYADSAASKVKSDLLNGAGTAYDTLKELGELIDDNKDAIDALETIASGKANATHGHEISEVSGLQTALDGKANSSHGTHVSFDSTNKPKMDGTAAFGTSTKVARADHVHPTDTSRASKTEFDTHVGDTVKHVTSDERANWGNAYAHSQSAHAPSNAEKNQNAFSNVKVGSVTVAADSVTDTFEIAAGTGITVTGDATNDKVTIANSGVIAVSTGTANGTISVNTNGSTANVAVKGLGTAAYTNSSAYATADHGHTVDSQLSSSSTNPVQNKVVNTAISTLTSTVSTNTNSISAHTTAITTMQNVLNDITEITSEEIRSLFSA